MQCKRRGIQEFPFLKIDLGSRNRDIDAASIEFRPLKTAAVLGFLIKPQTNCFHFTDMSRVKRVRFADLDTVGEINRQPDASSSPAKSSLPRSSDNPKTSEYQYYQKLRQAASRKVHSYLPDKHTNHLNDIEASNYMEADRLKSSMRDAGCSVRSCLPHQEESHLRNSEASNHMGVDKPKTTEYQFIMKLQEDTFHSVRSHPPHKQDNPLKKIGASNCTGELCNLVRQKYEVSRLLTPIEKVTPIELKYSSLADRASRNSELQYKQGEIFSRKRHKLLKLAAEALSRDVNEFSSNGSDLLLEFLRRLGIESNASNNGGILRSRLVDLDINSTLLANPETSLSFEEVPYTTKTYLMPSTSIHRREKGLPECWDAEADTRIHPLWDSLDAHSHSTGHAHETGLPYKSNQSDSVWDGGRTTSLHTGRNSTFGIDLGTEFSFNRSRCFMLEHMPSDSDLLAHKILPSPAYSPEQVLVLRNISSLRELDEIYGPKEPALARERCHLQLLGWADSSLVNEPELSIASHKTGMNLNPMATDHWRSFDSSLDAIASCSPSLLHKRNPPNSTLQKLLLDWSPSSTIGRYILGEGGFPVEESDNFPLILSHTQNSLDLTEGCGLSGDYKERNRSIFLSEASQEKCHPSLDAVLLPSNLDLEFGWKSLSPTNFCSENNLLACPHLQFHEKKIEDLSKCMRTCNEFNGHRTHSHSTDDTLNICDLVSFSCELPLNQKRARRLLLDRPSWHNDGDISSD